MSDFCVWSEVSGGEQVVGGLLPRWLNGKELLANAGDSRDVGSIPGLGRSLGVGNGNPPQYPCLGNPMDRGA